MIPMFFIMLFTIMILGPAMLIAIELDRKWKSESIWFFLTYKVCPFKRKFQLVELVWRVNATYSRSTLWRIPKKALIESLEADAKFMAKQDDGIKDVFYKQLNSAWLLN